MFFKNYNVFLDIQASMKMFGVCNDIWLRYLLIMM